MRAVLDWVRESFMGPSPTVRIAGALDELHQALVDADEQGLSFTPEARLARTALRAIGWR